MTFPAFCSILGITLPEPMPIGRWVDCATQSNPRRKKGRAKLTEDGQAGFCIDYLTMSECAVWTPHVVNDIKRERTAEENAALSKRLALRRQEEIRGTMRAQSAYAKAAELTHANHEYLRRKKLDMNGCRGLKIDAEGWLLIPVYRDGKFISAQRISAEGEKRFATGAPMKGGSYRIWRPAACVTILAEGLATGLCVFAALPQAQVEVCFSAANMIEVAKRGTWLGMVGIAGDNDMDTFERIGKNTGIEAAKEAAKAIGCGYAAPEHIEGSDWDDWFRERLVILEKAEEQKAFRASPIKLRQAALMPIRVALMGVVKNIQKNV